VVTGPAPDPVRLSADRPERIRRSFRLYRRGPDPARGDMVIGAFVLARLLGIRLLTLEARVVVHEDDGGGSGAITLSPAPPDRPALDPDPPSRRVRLERPGRPGRGAGSDRLARAVQLVEEGADTLERTRRDQYRG
jgi:hypothetical protein